MAKFNHLLGFARATASHAFLGFPEVPEAVYQQRLSICADCPHQKENHICGACACRLLVKARWADMDCPICQTCGRKQDAHPDAICPVFVSKWATATAISQTSAPIPQARGCCGS